MKALAQNPIMISHNSSEKSQSPLHDAKALRALAPGCLSNFTFCHLPPCSSTQVKANFLTFLKPTSGPLHLLFPPPRTQSFPSCPQTGFPASLSFGSNVFCSELSCLMSHRSLLYLIPWSMFFLALSTNERQHSLVVKSRLPGFGS